MTKKFPNHPANPERICWGCDLYCAADSMKCGNGSDRTQHPYELFGEDWRDWGHDFVAAPNKLPQAVEDEITAPENAGTVPPCSSPSMKTVVVTD